MHSEISYHRAKCSSIDEMKLHCKVKSLTGLTHSTEGKAFAEARFEDSLKASSGYQHARGEVLYRIDCLNNMKKEGIQIDGDELRALEHTDARLAKSHESIKKLDPKSWYGKFGKFVTTALRGIFDSLKTFLTRHPTVADILDPTYF
jgi:hypothetical protein